MKIKSLSLATIIIALLFACNPPERTSLHDNPYILTTAENIDDYPVKVITFHSTSRCKLCLTIEATVKETVLTEYKDQLESGKMKLFILNVDNRENRNIAEEYLAFGSALFVSSGNGEQSLTSDITNEAFLYAEANPDRFLDVLRSTINQHLN